MTDAASPVGGGWNNNGTRVLIAFPPPRCQLPPALSTPLHVKPTPPANTGTENEMDARRCDHCGSVFTTGPSDKKFCNTRCRNAYHKLRRAKALAVLDQMQSEGASPVSTAEVGDVLAPRR